MSDSKQCTRCLEVKSLELFPNKWVNGKIGKQAQCKACFSFLHKKENLSPQQLIALAVKRERDRIRGLVCNLTEDQLEVRREKDRAKAAKARANI